jgi:protein gp37
MAHRFYRGHLTTTAGKFNGHVVTRPNRLDIPLRTRKPTVWAIWNDWCHENVPFDFIGDMFEVIEKCPQHTFLLLTKRAWRAVEIMDWLGMSDDAPPLEFGLQNIYFGCTVCNQAEADEKLPEFLRVPGKKWLSIEPMLGPVDFRPFLGFWQWSRSENFQTWVPHDPPSLDLVICGGETGPGARPMHPDWVRSVRDQCAASGVPFFLKQNGEWVACFMVEDETKYDCQTVEGTIMCKVGHKRAGRLLDGQEWNALPWR